MAKSSKLSGSAQLRIRSLNPLGKTSIRSGGVEPGTQVAVGVVLDLAFDGAYVLRMSGGMAVHTYDRPHPKLDPELI